MVDKSILIWFINQLIILGVPHCINGLPPLRPLIPQHACAVPPSHTEDAPGTAFDGGDACWKVVGRWMNGYLTGDIHEYMNILYIYYIYIYIIDIYIHV